MRAPLLGEPLKMAMTFGSRLRSQQVEPGRQCLDDPLEPYRVSSAQ